ncbi:hypothetical protein MICAK_220022 [Microcystis aeruginosa PCC 9701]|uniref:Uncharacterized protein n=1 Tax=Microcystis aeruginosa PCC 9701 TaxID=721123 RepID=I4IP28_MICAE|nr:hypothetical protein MICAK_220022 [Microcystis aeruginosa PCC 9701]
MPQVPYLTYQRCHTLYWVLSEPNTPIQLIGWAMGVEKSLLNYQD